MKVLLVAVIWEHSAARNTMLGAVQLFRTEQGRPCRRSKSINDNVGYDSQSPRRSSGFLAVSSTSSTLRRSRWAAGKEVSPSRVCLTLNSFTPLRIDLLRTAIDVWRRCPQFVTGRKDNCNCYNYTSNYSRFIFEYLEFCNRYMVTSSGYKTTSTWPKATYTGWPKINEGVWIAYNFFIIIFFLFFSVFCK